MQSSAITLCDHHCVGCLTALRSCPVLLLRRRPVWCSCMMSLVLHRPRKGSTPAAQPMPSSLASAGTPPLHRGSPYSRSLPESSQSSALYHYGQQPSGRPPPLIGLRHEPCETLCPRTRTAAEFIKRLVGNQCCSTPCALVLHDRLR